jgi:hypothetical protein
MNKSEAGRRGGAARRGVYPRGTCAHCGCRVAVRDNGNAYSHNDEPLSICPGVDLPALSQSPTEK